MGLAITVKGRFEEADPNQQLAGTREFSRAFVLGPSKPGAPHPYRVISDELTMRTWTPRETPATIVPAPVPAPVADAVPAVPIMAQPPVVDDVTRAQMIQELSRQTGMTAGYAELCLAGMANWDYALALRSFEEKKGELPPEAFVQPA